MIVTRVVISERVVYELLAPLNEFASWVNGIPKGNVLVVNDFEKWTRKDGTFIYIDRMSVVAAYERKLNE